MRDVLVDWDVVHPRAPHEVGQVGWGVYDRGTGVSQTSSHLAFLLSVYRVSEPNGKATSRLQIRKPALCLSLVPGSACSHWYLKAQHRPGTSRC